MPRDPERTENKKFARPLYMIMQTVQLTKVGGAIQGGRGDYEAVLTFRHPVQPAGVESEVPHAHELQGDSGIGIPGEVELEVETPDVPSGKLRVRLVPNDRRNLAKAVVRLEADGFARARSIAFSHVGALLSRLGFEADAPIIVRQIDVTERATGSEQISVLHRGQTRRFEPFPPDLRVAPPFFRAAFAVYREGLNSTSPYYALLCFFRVIEGARRYRGKQAPYARGRGIDLSLFPEPVVENLDEIGRDFPKAIGRRCADVAQQDLADYRHVTAHGADLDDPHAPDQLNEEDRYWLAVPLARQVARKLLEREWELRSELGFQTIPELDPQ